MVSRGDIGRLSLESSPAQGKAREGKMFGEKLLSPKHCLNYFTKLQSSCMEGRSVFHLPEKREAQRRNNGPRTGYMI